MKVVVQSSVALLSSRNQTVCERLTTLCAVVNAPPAPARRTPTAGEVLLGARAVHPTARRGRGGPLVVSRF